MFDLSKRLGLKPLNLKTLMENILFLLLYLMPVLEVLTYTYGESIATFAIKLYVQGATLIMAMFYAYWLHEARKIREKNLDAKS